MTTSEEWGHLTNARFSRSLLTWDPEEGRLVGQLVATGPISRYQYVSGLATPPRIWCKRLIVIIVVDHTRRLWMGGNDPES